MSILIGDVCYIIPVEALSKFHLKRHGRPLRAGRHAGVAFYEFCMDLKNDASSTYPNIEILVSTFLLEQGNVLFYQDENQNLNFF